MVRPSKVPYRDSFSPWIYGMHKYTLVDVLKVAVDDGFLLSELCIRKGECPLQLQCQKALPSDVVDFKQFPFRTVHVELFWSTGWIVSENVIFVLQILKETRNELELREQLEGTRFICNYDSGAFK